MTSRIRTVSTMTLASLRNPQQPPKTYAFLTNDLQVEKRKGAQTECIKEPRSDILLHHSIILQPQTVALTIYQT